MLKGTWKWSEKDFDNDKGFYRLNTLLKNGYSMDWSVYRLLPLFYIMIHLWCVYGFQVCNTLKLLQIQFLSDVQFDLKVWVELNLSSVFSNRLESNLPKTFSLKTNPTFLDNFPVHLFDPLGPLCDQIRTALGHNLVTSNCWHTHK